MKYILITLICVLLSVNIAFAQSYASSSASASAQAESASSFASSSSTASTSPESLFTATSTSGAAQAQATARMQNEQSKITQSSYSQPTTKIINNHSITSKALTVKAPIQNEVVLPPNIEYISLIPTKDKSTTTKTEDKDYQKDGTKIAQLIPLGNHNTETIKKQDKRIDKIGRLNKLLTIGFLALAIILLVLIITLIASNKTNKSKKYF